VSCADAWSFLQALLAAKDSELAALRADTAAGPTSRSSGRSPAAALPAGAVEAAAAAVQDACAGMEQRHSQLTASVEEAYRLIESLAQAAQARGAPVSHGREDAQVQTEGAGVGPEIGEWTGWAGSGPMVVGG
jgi:hypothetical protein